MTGKPSPFTHLLLPAEDVRRRADTLNTLVTLEDAFIAAYLVGVRNFRPPTCGSPRRGSWASRATTARSRASWRRASPRPTAARSSASPGSRAGRVGRPAQQQRLRADAAWNNIGQAVERAAAVRRQDGRRKGRLRHQPPYQFQPFTPKLPSRSASSTASGAERATPDLPGTSRIEAPWPWRPPPAPGPTPVAAGPPRSGSRGRRRRCEVRGCEIDDASVDGTTNDATAAIPNAMQPRRLTAAICHSGLRRRQQRARSRPRRTPGSRR